MTITDKFIKKFETKTKEETRKLYYDFFIAFPRFEYALKQSNLGKCKNNKIEPDWNEFIIEIRPVFNSSERTKELNDAINHILKYPPKQQKCETKDSTTFTWDVRTGFSVDTPDNLDKLNQYIRDMRNNLFHGEKIMAKFGSNRNFLLLKNALIVLNNWLELHEKVRYNFNNFI